MAGPRDPQNRRPREGSDRPLLRSPDAVLTVALRRSFADPKPPRRTAGGAADLRRCRGYGWALYGAA
jgi:hypothetical protein